MLCSRMVSHTSNIQAKSWFSLHSWMRCILQSHRIKEVFWSKSFWFKMCHSKRCIPGKSLPYRIDLASFSLELLRRLRQLRWRIEACQNVSSQQSKSSWPQVPAKSSPWPSRGRTDNVGLWGLIEHLLEAIRWFRPRRATWHLIVVKSLMLITVNIFLGLSTIAKFDHFLSRNANIKEYE